VREILFRGKRLDNGEWAQGFFFQTWEQAFILWGTTNGIQNMIAVDPSTIGQYTGLTDKNGKKIFGGDRVKQFFGATESDYTDGVVYWINHDQAFCVCRCGEPNAHYGDLGNYNDGKCLEVVGTIHDNPELITP